MEFSPIIKSFSISSGVFLLIFLISQVFPSDMKNISPERFNFPPFTRILSVELSLSWEYGRDFSEIIRARHLFLISPSYFARPINLLP